MKAIISCFLIGIGVFLKFVSLFAVELDQEYPSVVEKLIFYKDNHFKVFYGGPIQRSQEGVRWVMPVSFEDETYRTRAVYEIAFINCTPFDSENADLLFVDVADINIKFKNVLSKDYEVFSHLLNGNYQRGKYIVIRSSDISNLFYPDIHVSSLYSERKESDKNTIGQFLHTHCNTKKSIRNYYIGGLKEEIDFTNNQEISYKPISVKIDLAGALVPFTLIKKILKNDEWKVYYIISKDAQNNKPMINQTTTVPADQTNWPLIRIDSGCVSGQIYDDDSCDCLDQLHDGLYQIAQEVADNSLIIHIPTQDGRGYGMAPKCETEIYKHGGKGRVHETAAVNTVEGAKLLYPSGIYDIRTYDGVAEILKGMGLKQVALLTDNIVKVEALQRHHIEVLRKKTETQKQTCATHIESKKNSECYYKN